MHRHRLLIDQKSRSWPRRDFQKNLPNRSVSYTSDKNKQNSSSNEAIKSSAQASPLIEKQFGSIEMAN